MLLYTLAFFVVSLGYGIVVPVLPDLVGAGTSDAGQFSIVYASYAAFKIIAQLPAGAWVDRVGGRRVMFACLVVFTASLALFLVPGPVPYFGLVRALEGAATGALQPALFALALEGAAPSSSGRRLGAMIGIGSAGLLVGPALGAVLAPYGVRAPLIVALALAIVVTVACAPWWRQPTVVRPSPRAPTSLGAELDRVRALARNGLLLALCLPVAFNKLTFSAMQGILPLHGVTLGLGPHGIAGLFVMTGVAWSLAQIVGGRVVDRKSPRAVTIMLLPVLLTALVAMSASRGALEFTLAYGLYALASSVIFTATLKQVAADRETTDAYGGVFGMVGTLTDTMTVVGPLLFLNLFASSGPAVFAIMAAVAVPFALGYVARTAPTARPVVDRSCP